MQNQSKILMKTFTMTVLKNCCCMMMVMMTMKTSSTTITRSFALHKIVIFTFALFDYTTTDTFWMFAQTSISKLHWFSQKIGCDESVLHYNLNTIQYKLQKSIVERIYRGRACTSLVYLRYSKSARVVQSTCLPKT